MTKNEFEMILELINRDILNKDVGDLKKISTYLTNQLLEINSDIDVDSNYDILMQNLVEFIKENTTSEERSKIRYETFINFVAIYRKTTYYDVCVFDILGIDEFVSKRACNIGERTLKFYEKLLNQYGLSIKQRLSINQRKYLNNERKKLNKTR